MAGHDLIVPPGGITTSDQRDDLDAAVDAFAASAKSAATRRAYRADARDFIAWCAGQGAEPLPAKTRTVARYVTSLVGRGLSVSTIDRRVAAIAALHRAKGWDTPTAREEVRTVLAGIWRMWMVQELAEHRMVLHTLPEIIARMRAYRFNETGTDPAIEDAILRDLEALAAQEVA
ncbi:MAG: site-specific integrase [Janthinobacterium lividum]